MSLERLARELDETARQTAELANGVSEALQTLADSNLSEAERCELASSQIINALQGQDRIEQRCRNMADAVRNLVASDRSIDHPRFDEIWSRLTLDELAVPELSGIAARTPHGEVDLF